ncbi:MAG TPA: hypothetical protein DET40_25955 [Lentisphaeria bacterium]|nr:MAG: hypothetical protein A2X45_15050 [Lentisphaerae bacterium GWF2_50_93]HCE47007.1 hypothetical protein [Lentisphaeria bacterium]
MSFGKIKIPAWIPIPIFAFIIFAFVMIKPGFVYDPPYLLPALTLIFMVLISLHVAILAGRSYLVEHSASVLFIGCGTLVLGLAGALAVFPFDISSANRVITIYNSGACLAALFHLLGAITGFPDKSRIFRGGLTLLSSMYLAIFAITVLLAVGTSMGLMPVFFVDGKGATAWNVAALYASAGMFAASSVMMHIRCARGGSDFLKYYSVGLGLIAVGLIGVSFQVRLGCSINWTSRISQYLGCIYLMVAVITTFRRHGGWKISIEKALHDMEERYHALVETSPEAIFVNRENIIVFVNPAAVKLFGAESKEQLLGRSPFDLFVPEYHPLMRERIKTVLGGGLIPKIETNVQRLDGKKIDVEIIASLIVDSGVKSSQVMLHDITERKRTEEALRASEAKYRGLFESVQEGFYLAEAVFDEKGMLCDAIYREVNPAFLQLMGREREQVVGKRMKELVPNIRPGWFEAFGSVTLTGQSATHSEYSETFGRHFEAVIFRPAKGYFGVIVNDVTVRKQAEDALRSSEERLRMVLQSSSMGIFEVDLVSGEERWNDVEYELLGLKTGEIPPGPESFFRFVHPEDIKMLQANWDEALHSGKLDAEFRIVRADGEVRWLAGKGQFIVEKIKDSAGNFGRPIRFLGVNFDITERKRADEVRSFLAQTGSGSKGESFFNVLARYLAQSLQMDFVCIDRLDVDGLTAHTVSVWCDGDFEDNVSYALKDTPCGEVVGKTVCCFPASVCQFFPRDQVLRDRKAESYVGVTLWNLAGKPIGLIAVIGHKPLANRAQAEETLKLVSMRAASELERNQSDEALLNSRTAAMNLMEDADEARRKVEQKSLELRESQSDLNRAQAVAQIGSWRLDVQKNELIWSDENHRIFSIPKGAEMTYETFLSTIHPDDVLHVDQAWKDALKGEPYDVEHRIIVGGKIKWVRERAELEFDSKGDLLGGFGTTQDVTERKIREEELQRLNRTLKALSHSNQVMMRATSESEYMNEICRIIVGDCGHKMVWIGFAENDENKTVRPVASAGFEEGYLGKLNISWSDTERGQGPTGTAIRTGEICYCRNMITDPKFKPWRNDALKRGYASSVVVPLLDKSGAFGAINIYSKEPDSFSEKEMDLISELVGDLAHGIMELRLRKLHVQTEEALIKSERRYRTLFDGMTEGFALHEIICDDAGKPVDYRFLEVNPAFEKLTGLKRRDVLYMMHSEILPGDDPKWVEIYGKVALAGEPVEFENYSPVLKKDFQVFAYSPAPRQFAVIFLDITERKKAERELRQAEKRQSILSESAAAMLQAVDPQEVVDEVCGKTMEFLDCQVFFNFLFVEDKDKLQLNAYSGISEAESRRIEWLDFGTAVCGCVARDGQRIIAEDILTTEDPRTDLVRGYGVRAYCCHPLKTGDKVLGTISFGTKNRDKFSQDDISMMKATAELVTVALQRKEWEKKLVESEERLRLAQISANVGVWEWNPQNGSFISTPELSRLYGESPYAITKYQDLQRKVHPDDIARFEKERREAIASRRSFDLEFRVNYSQDEIRWLSSKGGAVYDDDGEVIRVFGVNADITVRKMAEEVLKRDKETLESIVKERTEKMLEIQLELERAKRLSDIGTLASTVAHELRNPLAAITMSAAIIRRKAKNEIVEEMLGNIDKMVTESDQIINNLLFYSRLRSPHRENIAIYEILEECVDNLSRQIKRNIHFKRSFEPLKDVMLNADPLQMKEVLHNLLHNAADAVPDECGEVEVLAEDTPESIRIQVRDNGHGIDAQHKEKIFDPFFTTKAKGTGLGLTVCNQVVNMHGGSIGIESELDKGTTMTITLPKKERGQGKS